MTFGPATQISPISPVETSCPSRSRIVMRTLGTGKPTDPALRSPSKGFTQVTGEHSVGPSPSKIGTPYRDSNDLSNSTGMAAPPATPYRIVLNFAACSSGRRFTTAYIEGTPKKIVAPLAATMSLTKAGSNLGTGVIDNPCKQGVRMPTVAAKE